MFTRFIIFPAFILTLILTFLVGIIAPLFAESGNEIIFSTDQAGGSFDLHVMDVTRNLDMLRLTHNNDIESCPRYSPDGNQIVYNLSTSTDDDGLRLISADGRVIRYLLDADFLSGTWFWSPKLNEATLAYIAREDEQSLLVTVDVNTGASHEIVRTNDFLHLAFQSSDIWSSSGEELFYSNGNAVYGVNINTQMPRLIHDLQLNYTSITALSVYEDSLAIVDSYHSDITIINTETLNSTRIHTPDLFIYAFDWSPNGEHIAILGEQEDRIVVYLVAPDGTNLRQINYFDGFLETGWNIQWSSNNQWLSIEVNANLYIVDMNSSDIIQTLPANSCPDWRP